MSVSEKVILAFVRQYLRKASLRWKPIYETRLRNRRPYTGPLKGRKHEYLCDDCGGYFPNSVVQVHHIKPVGSLLTLADLPGFVTRLLCNGDGLKLLCKTCHGKY